MGSVFLYLSDSHGLVGVTGGETMNACIQEFSFCCAEILSTNVKLILPITAFGFAT